MRLTEEAAGEQFSSRLKDRIENTVETLECSFLCTLNAAFAIDFPGASGTFTRAV